MAKDPYLPQIYMRIIKYCQDIFGVRYIRDYPPMIIFSVPTPDLVKSIEEENTTFSAIADATKKLEQNGCDFIIIACNSLQYFIDKLQKLVKIPIIGIAPVVAKYVNNKGYKTVGIIASDTVIKKKIYSNFLESFGIKVLVPNKIDQKASEEIMLNVIGGKTQNDDKNKLISIIKNLRKKGAETILLACTELPLVIKQTDTDISLIDCNQLYVIEAAKLSVKFLAK